MGWEYQADLSKHESQTDATKGFGGKYGVQTDRVDKVTVATCCFLPLLRMLLVLPLSQLTGLRIWTTSDLVKGQSLMYQVSNPVMVDCNE